MSYDQQVVGIEKQISQLESEAEEHLKNALTLESEANSLEANEVWDKAAKKYYDAGQQFFKACIRLESTRFWIVGLKNEVLEKLKFRENDERYIQNKKKLKEYHKKSADLFKKSSEILGKLRKKLGQAEMLGLAVREYFRVFELSEEEELKIEMKDGEVYCFEDTFVGNIVSLYRSAASLFNDIGIEFEEAGKISQAYVFYGYMGDAYLSIAFIQEKNRYWPFVSDQAESYLCAAEAYRKSGSLSQKIGVSKIVAHARIEWKHAQGEIHNFFKDDKGYSVANDLDRAIITYKKARRLYEKLDVKSQVEYCSRMIQEIEDDIEEFNIGKPTHLIPMGTSLTGYPWADQEHSRIMHQKIPLYIPSEDWKNYRDVLASLLNYMGQNLADNFFRGQDYDENDFHKDLSRHLKRDASIGVKALNEVYTGGGRVDILVRGVPVELKVEKTTTDTKEAIEKHQSQASHYASSQGKQVGILCILDLTSKEKPIPPPSNDVCVVQVPVHGFERQEIVHPAILIALIIRGNLPTPSSLS